MIRILMVEDSSADVRSYRKALEGMADLELIHAESAEAALPILRRQRIDLFFLDVELPGKDGFELAGYIRERPEYALAMIVFITGYEKNPLEAFQRFHCYDFIQKPFTIEKFRGKMQDLLLRLSMQKEAEARPRRRLARLLTPGGEKFVPADDLIYAEVSHNKTAVQTREELISPLDMTLQDVLEAVDSPDFLRCHKSFAVNVNEIAAIEKINYRLSRLKLIHSDVDLEMSATYAHAVRARLERRTGGLG